MLLNLPNLPMEITSMDKIVVQLDLLSTILHNQILYLLKMELSLTQLLDPLDPTVQAVSFSFSAVTIYLVLMLRPTPAHLKYQLIILHLFSFIKVEGMLQLGIEGDEIGCSNIKCSNQDVNLISN